MKSKYAVVLTIAVIVIAAIGIVFWSSGSSKLKTVRAGGVLTVNDIQADPTAYKGTITIKGVMAGVSDKDPKIFGLIDTSEAITCKQTGCANFYLPVKYEGTQPKDWDEVNVTGNFINGGVFVATKVDFQRHLNL